MQRDLKIDSLKGFAILLVVLGHAIQYSTTNFDNNIAFRVIYSFHMPLFMFLSGYIAYGRPINLQKKFTSLVIPFITWYLLLFLVHSQPVSFADYIIRLVKSPDVGLWFLWVLFLNFCLLKLCTRVPKHKDLSIIVGMILVKYLPIYALGIGFIKWHFTFFAAGYLLSKYKKQLTKFQRPCSLLAALFFPLLISQWFRIQQPIFSPIVKQWFSAHHLRGGGFLLVVYSYVVPLLGIAIAFLIINLISKTPLYSILSKLGFVSLEIYALHQNLLFGFGSGAILVISNFLIGLLLSFGLTMIIKQSNLLSRLLFGRRSIKPRLNNNSSLAGL